MISNPAWWNAKSIPPNPAKRPTTHGFFTLNEIIKSKIFLLCINVSYTTFFYQHLKKF